MTVSEIIRAAAKKWFYESFDCDLLEKMEKTGLISQAEGFSVSVMAELELEMESAFDAAQSELAALREELATAKRVGPPHFCGLPMSLNPHPEAGVPGRFLEVGTVRECIPCLVSSRHGWAKTAGDLQHRLTAAEQRNAELRVLLLKSESSVNYHLMDVRSRIPTTEHKELYRNKVADLQSIAGQIVAALKPTESGASE